MRSFSAGVLMAAGCILLTSQAHAGVLFSDTFAGSGALNGHAPAIAQNAGDTWSDPNNGFSLSAAGAATNAWGGNPIMANAPFHVDAGTVYTISAKVQATGGWIGVGFQSSAVAGPTWSLNMAPWFFNSDYYGNAKAFAFGTDDANAIAIEWGITPDSELSLVLDTTGPQWTVASFMGGVQKGSTYTYATNPTIEYVSLIRTGASGAISNLQISAVPEPATAAVLALATGLLCLRRRA